MASAKKVVLHCQSNDQSRLDELVEQFMRDGVIFVGVVGIDCERVAEIIDELCVGDGEAPYDLLTSSHPNESLEAVVAFAKSLTSEFSGEADVIEL